MFISKPIFYYSFFYALPNNSLSICFLEPQILEPAVRFQPLPDALAILELEKTVLFCDGDDRQSQNGMKPMQVSPMCNKSDFAEHITSEILSRKIQKTEDFRKLSPEHPKGEWLAAGLQLPLSTSLRKG